MKTTRSTENTLRSRFWWKNWISVLAILLISGIAQAAVFPDESEANQNLRMEVIQYIGHPKVDDVNVSADIFLQFFVNSDGEIVVLKTDNPEYDRMVKERLNYKSVKSDGVIRNQHYFIKLKVRS